MAKKYSLSFDDEVGRELEDVAKSVGFLSVEDLFTNYAREVILASRADRAAKKARDQVIGQSDDLDKLIPERNQDTASGQ